MLLLSWAFAMGSGSSAVFADQPSDDLSTIDPGGHVDHLARIVRRRAERTALMRAVMIEVAFVLGQDPSQVPFWSCPGLVDTSGLAATRQHNRLLR
ncbi:MAG: hypothetical protein ACRDP6_18350 [Actinoallomurus sp.]